MLLVEPCAIHHLQTLLAGKEQFFHTFGIAVIEDYELVSEWVNLKIKKTVKSGDGKSKSNYIAIALFTIMRQT